MTEAATDLSIDNTLPVESRGLKVARWLIKAWVFVVVLALWPYTANPAAPIKNLLTGWTMVAVCLAYLYAVVREHAGLRITSATFLLIFLFIGLHANSALQSDFPAASLFSLRPWLGGLLLAVMAGNAFRTTQQLWNLILSVVLAVSCSSIYGYLQKFGLDPFPWSARNIEEYLGMPSTYANPNFAGHTLMLASFMAAGLLLFKRKWICLFELALVGSHLYYTHMRGARVAIAASLLLLALYVVARGARRDPVRVAALTLAALVIAGAGGIVAGIFYGTLKTDGIYGVDTPMVLRLNGYYGAARMALERPWTGIGPGNYDTESPRMWTPFEQRWFASEGKKNDHVHNDALETAAEAGFPGVAAYFALLLWGVLGGLVLAGQRADKSRTGLGYVLAACIGAFAVDGLFGFNLRVPASSGVFFLMLGMVHAGLRGPVAWRAWHIPAQIALTLLALVVALANSASFYADARYQEARGAQSYAEERRATGDGAQMRAGYEAGLAILARGEQWLPFDGRFAETRAQFLSAMGRLDEADAAFTQAVAMSPYSPSLYAAHAQLRARMAFQRDALDVLDGAPDPAMPALLDATEKPARRALGLCPVLPAAEDVLGRMALLRAKHEPARKAALLETARGHLENALEHGARDRGEVNRALAQAHAGLGHVEEAEAAYRRAVESAPENEALWEEFLGFAQHEHRTKGYADSLTSAMTSLRAQEGKAEVADTLALRLAGFLAYTLKRPAEAESLAREVASHAPARAGAWGMLASLHGGEPLAALKAVLEEATVQGVPAWVETLAGATQGGAFLTAVDTLPEVLRAAVSAGMTVPARQREYYWAGRALEHALPQAGLDAAQEGHAWAQIATGYDLLGRAKEAEVAAGRAIALLAPEAQAGPWLVRAHALGVLKRPAEALEAARKAAALAPGNLVVRAGLAKALADAGRTAEAQFEFANLLKSLPPGSPEQREAVVSAQRLEARVALKQGGAA